MERKKIVLIGAGSAVFTKGLIADFIKSDFGSWEIALCDINPVILDSVAKLARKMVEIRHMEDRIQITAELRESLEFTILRLVYLQCSGNLLHALYLGTSTYT